MYVADDHPMFLEAILAAIRDRPELELVGSASSGHDAAAGIAALEPDVAVLDMRLRGLSGHEVLDHAAAQEPHTRFLFLSAHVESDLVYAALASGAAGYLSKEIDRDAICEAIVAVADGETVLSPDVQRNLAGAIRQRDVREGPVLTPRELAVLALVAEGLATHQIAARLKVAPATVKSHLRSINHKLDVPDRTSAVAAAMRRGLLE
ncbi:MAG TPA: response regulator transcription factor [Solirubrobacter sp.]|nr:response regulator transcription factor [Solirubrobacter sp.]